MTQNGPLAYHGTSTPASVGLWLLTPAGRVLFGDTPNRPYPVDVCGMPIIRPTPYEVAVLTMTGSRRSRIVRMYEPAGRDELKRNRVFRLM
jgi:hypothetical protein